MTSVLIQIKQIFFAMPDSKTKQFFVLLYERWMNFYLPALAWFLYFLRHRRIDKNHQIVLSGLKEKDLIKIVFLVKENAKWGWDSLYRAFDEDPLFEPTVAVIFFGLPQSPNALQKASFDANYEFFQSREMRVVKAYDKDKDEFVDLRTFEPNIVFYEPPWHLPKIQDVPEVSKYALTCHTPYGMNLAKNAAQYCLPFLQLIWRQFVESESIKEYLSSKSVNKGRNIESFGYPKLDVYMEQDCCEPNELWSVSSDETPQVKRIIYAPHWSFNVLHFATFDWNGEFLLKYAKTHQKTDWLFKPHPRLRYALQQDLNWSKNQVSDYYAAWDALPNGKVSERGGYFDYFQTSDALITDCVSFLGEYIYTKKPIIHLRNPQSIEYNPIGERISKEFYKAYDLVELERLIDSVICKGEDVLCQKRMLALNIIPLAPKGAGYEIKEYIKRAIR